MTELGDYQELAPAARAVGSMAFSLALLVTSLLERLQLGLKAWEGRTWWASNGRDVLNAMAFAAVFGGLRVLGFPGPTALVIGALLVIAMSLVQSSLEKFPRLSVAMSLLLSMVVGLPVLLAPLWVHRGFYAALRWLF